MPTSRHQTKVGSVNQGIFTQPAIRLPTPTQNRIRATVSKNDSGLSGRRSSGPSSPGAVSSGEVATPVVPRRPCLTISRSATGPPMMPPMTRPKVAQAIATSIDPCRLLTSPNSLA